MLVNHSKLLEDVAEGMSHDLEEAKTKLLLGKFALGELTVGPVHRDHRWR